MNAASLYSLPLRVSHSLDDVEPHLSSPWWHRALPKDEREKWDKGGERKEEKEGEGWEKGVFSSFFPWFFKFFSYLILIWRNVGYKVIN